ncbi:1-aminocyclopropane-1-carboxylate deaminase/D-cysteine desulfhydrase [Thalassotalea euphylliae]|uniref:Pyridoxal-phosphate dependent enzyme n=1 Tax=Thalassotalea euphylliae TaxID=1655234 RepID=A0A3E0U7A8_9GAMM|nr:pyridoxal-phosphate dependent enzyme [Thalassotalea euphylliae]REL31812.1 pyridoxal-phosphate dependent enzyme [Thalassotalea euphylliae]
MSPLQIIEHPLFKAHQIEVYIKRDDLIHPIISGNKWRKLKGNLSYAKAKGLKGILSFGGAYSNHLHALAYACQQQELAAKAVIRGEPEYLTNYTLSWAMHWGLEPIFVDRQTYRQREQAEYLAALATQFPDYLIVPEGGSNQLALSGLAELVEELNQQISFDTLMLPVGSGGTIAGIINADQCQHQILGIAVLKQADYLRNNINQLLSTSQNQTAKTFNNWQLLTEFHRGGYGKFSDQDCLRLAEFIAQTGVPFEPIYSGKIVLALLDLIAQGYFPAGHKIVLLHTGGLQGLGGQIERGLLPNEFIKAVQSHLPSAPQVQ